MITTRESYKEYLELDRKALGKKRLRPKLFGDEVWKFQRSLRALEFLNNGYATTLERLLFRPLVRVRYRKLSLACGFSIPCNTFGAGLSIAHRGTIVVNSKARIGRLCRIHIDVNIGASGGDGEAPLIGDRVYIGPGAKIFGPIEVASDCVIGANAVVNRSVFEEGVTVAGVPAKVVSTNSSAGMLKAA